MKKVVRLTEVDLVNLIKGTINELEHDADGYAKYVKREDYLNATSILVQNELIDNGLDVYVEEHSWHALIVEGHKEEDPNRELNIKLIIIEFETFYDDDYELSSDMTDMKLKIYHIGNNVPTFATYNLLDGLDLLIGFKNKGLLPSTNNETINESFGNDDFIEVLSTEVHNELVDNGLNVIEGASTTFPGRLWVVGHEAPLPDHPVTISEIRIDFDLSPYDDDSGPYLDMRIYFHGAANHEADKSFKVENGIDFILKLKEEGKLPNNNSLQEQIDPITVGKNIVNKLMNRFKPKPVQKGPLPFDEKNLSVELAKQGVSFPDVAMAQAKLETGHFKSNVFRENNNLFGMKHPSVRETVSLGPNRGHAKYATWQDSVKDYKLWQDFYKVSAMNKSQFINKLNNIYCMPPVCKAGDYANKVKSLMG